jgi:translation initiation factor IF-2
VKRAILVLLSAVLMMGWMVGPASTHTKNIGSRVSLSVSDKTPKKGNFVKFKVKVNSNNAKCEKGRTVKLVRNSRVIDKGTTNADGFFKARVKIKEKGNFWAVAKKKPINMAHPHAHLCTKQVSSSFKVKPHR